jgi:hypothetical protein
MVSGVSTDTKMFASHNGQVETPDRTIRSKDGMKGFAASEASIQLTRPTFNKNLHN